MTSDNRKAGFVRPGVPFGPILLGLALLGAVPGALACADPSLHPEWHVFNAKVEALGDQPNIHVDLFYRSKGKRFPKRETVITLAFKARPQAVDPTFTLVPSDGLEVLNLSTESHPVPAEHFELRVRPTDTGLHYLTVVMSSGSAEARQHKTVLVPFEVFLHGNDVPSFAPRFPVFGQRRTIGGEPAHDRVE